jgi:hypothetical protein
MTNGPQLPNRRAGPDKFVDSVSLSGESVSESKVSVRPTDEAETITNILLSTLSSWPSATP